MSNGFNYSLAGMQPRAAVSRQRPQGGYQIPVIQDYSLAGAREMPTGTGEIGYAPDIPGVEVPGVEVPGAGDTPGLGGLSGSPWMKNFSLGANALTGLAGAYNAYRQMGLMEDQYKASIADRNQQIANQAATTNLSLANQASMAAQMSGHAPGSEGYQQYLDEKQVQVSGAPIRA